MKKSLNHKFNILADILNIEIEYVDCVPCSTNINGKTVASYYDKKVLYINNKISNMMKDEDFIIRNSIFKCLKYDHKLIDLDNYSTPLVGKIIFDIIIEKYNNPDTEYSIKDKYYEKLAEK